MTLHDTMVADAGCYTDEKFYAVLARGCMQLHQPMKAIVVVRAAYHLPGHSMAMPAHKNARPVGVEPRVLDEIASRLRAGGNQEREALASLTTDLFEYRGVHIGNSQGASGSRSRGGNGCQRRGQQDGWNRSGK